MIDYASKTPSIPQKLFVILIELIFIWLAYWIFFLGGRAEVYAWLGKTPQEIITVRKLMILAFIVFTFFRFILSIFYLLKRKLRWSETFTVILPFGIYYLGYAFLTNTGAAWTWWDGLAVLVFLVGSLINTGSELQRHFWKQGHENKGKLYTKGLFKYAMHINFFGDLLWVSGFAMLTRNIWSIIVPIMLLALFVFFNIPELDKYLAAKYDGFDEYARKTKKLIPGIY